MAAWSSLIVLAAAVQQPTPTAEQALASYRDLTATTVCRPSDDPATITVCARRDRVAESQKLPLPDEIVATGPRRPTGEMPSAAMATAVPCGLNGCGGGIDVMKVAGALAHLADHILTGSD